MKKFIIILYLCLDNCKINQEMLRLADTFADEELFSRVVYKLHLYDHHGSLLRERDDRPLFTGCQAVEDASEKP